MMEVFFRFFPLFFCSFHWFHFIFLLLLSSFFLFHFLFRLAINAIVFHFYQHKKALKFQPLYTIKFNNNASITKTNMWNRLCERWTHWANWKRIWYRKLNGTVSRYKVKIIRLRINNMIELWEHGNFFQ